MTKSLTHRVLVMVLVSCMAGVPVRAQQAAKPNAPPDIFHEPVTKAIKGQALTMKAKVVDDKGQIGSVTLYYTLSRDAAPFKVQLKPAGLDYYVGTIDAGVLSGVSSLSYYIEAQDSWGATKETPWYVVAFREPTGADAAAGGGTAKIPAPNEKKDEKGGGVPLGLIAGGAVAVIGGAILIANGGGGGGGGDGGSDPEDPAQKQGNYVGSVTTCLTESGAQPSCESHACTITIDSSGKVLSANLREGQALTDTLSGNEFTLVASADDPITGTTGEIFYNGNVVNNSKIVGSISGSRSSTNSSGTYSGSFSATKQ